MFKEPTMIANKADSKRKAFDDRFKDALRNIEKCIEVVPEDKMRFGPTFVIDSAIGPITIDTVVYCFSEGRDGLRIRDESEWSNEGGRIDYVAEQYVFIARDRTDRIIGLRSDAIRPDFGNSIPFAKGQIDIGIKGKRLAVPLGVAFYKKIWCGHERFDSRRKNYSTNNNASEFRRD